MTSNPDIAHQKVGVMSHSVINLTAATSSQRWAAVMADSSSERPTDPGSRRAWYCGMSGSASGSTWRCIQHVW